MSHVGRPDPDTLLRNLEEREARNSRGRLKVFLGYAALVGKSVRMFDEGRRRLRRGQDVVVGAVQSRSSREAREAIEGLEVIPTRRVDGKEVLDKDAISRRCPQVCVIDELAHENPAGTPHRNRWEDVEEIVTAGITVITALNLQYIAEQQDAVERITGRRASCSVPLAFIRSADEIVLVDVPADGKRDAEGTLNGEQLSKLRELSLLISAEVVEDQLLRYMREHGIRKAWGTQERILVCITPRSHVREMLENAALVTSRFHAHLVALYVRQGELSRGDQEAVNERLDSARKLGADVHVLDCYGDPIQQIIDFAREQRITQLFIGHTQRKLWAFWKQNPVERLIEAAEGMDVRIFPNNQAG